MSLHKIWLIARREYLFNVRRRSYLFTVFVIPIISFGFSALSTGFANNQLDDQGNYKHVGVVDQANVLSAITLPVPFEKVASADQAAAALKAGTLDLYYVLPANYLSTGNIDSYSHASVAAGLDPAFQKLVREGLAAKLNDPLTVTRIEDPLPKVQIYKPGGTHAYDQSVLFNSIFVPLIFGMLLFLSTTTTSQFLMSGVVEEKENRMMELLSTSSRPSEMLWGKILGLGALGLTQILIWLLLILGIATVTSSFNLADMLANLQITPSLLVLIFAYFLLGYLLLSAIMAGIGASVNAEAESRQIAGIISFISIVPFVLFISFLADPNGSLPVLASLIPLTSPLSMIMRVSLTTVPSEQIVLSLIILAMTDVLAIWIAARVFRLGMLSYGKRLGIRDVVRAIRGGQHVLTTTTPTIREANAT